jgi:hypothetical protein
VHFCAEVRALAAKFQAGYVAPKFSLLAERLAFLAKLGDIGVNIAP